MPRGECARGRAHCRARRSAQGNTLYAPQFARFPFRCVRPLRARATRKFLFGLWFAFAVRALPLTFAHARLHLSLACRKSAFAFLAVSRAVRLRRLLHGFARVLIFSDNGVPEILLQKRSASRNIRSHLRARVSCGAPPPHEARSAR